MKPVYRFIRVYIRVCDIEHILIGISLSNELLQYLNHWLGLNFGIGRVLFLLALVLALFRVLWQRRVRRIPAAPLLGLGFLIAGLTVSLWWSLEVGHYLEIVGGIAVLVLLPFTWINPVKEMRQFAVVLMIVNLPLVIEAFLLGAAGEGFRYTHRVAPALANPIFWGRTCGCLAFLGIGLLGSSTSNSSRFVHLMFSFAYFVSMLMTNSRGPIFAFAVGVACFGAVYSICYRNFWKPLGVTICFLIIGGMLAMTTPYLSRTFQPDVGATTNVMSRLEMWEVALGAWAQEPFFGAKAVVYFEKIGAYPHNLVLDLMLRGGMLSLAGFFMFLIAFFRSFNNVLLVGRNFDRKVFYVLMSIALAAVVDLVSGFFSGTLDSHYIFWFAGASVIAASVREKGYLIENNQLSLHFKIGVKGL